MGQPDDPANPNRARPPRLENNPDVGKLEALITDLARKVLPHIRAHEIIPNANREFMAYCFLAETGLMASEVVLVEEETTVAPGHKRRKYWYEQRYPSDPVHQNAMRYLEIQCREMAKANKKLAQDNLDLIAKLKDFMDPA